MPSVPGVVPPPALLPAKPTAMLQILERLSEVIDSLSLASEPISASGSRVRRRLTVPSRSRASALWVTRFQLNAPAPPAAGVPESEQAKAPPPLAALRVV